MELPLTGGARRTATALIVVCCAIGGIGCSLAVRAPERGDGGPTADGATGGVDDAGPGARTFGRDADASDARDDAPSTGGDDAAVDSRVDGDGTAQVDADTIGEEDGGEGGVDAGPEDAGPLAELRICNVPSTSFGDPEQRIACSNDECDPMWGYPPCDGVSFPTFVLPGIPPPESIVSATLRYDCYDCDHPGAEGSIRVNGAAASPMWADVESENEWRAGLEVDVTSLVRAGENTVVFSPEGSVCGYYWIRRVEVVLEAWLLSCPDA